MFKRKSNIKILVTYFMIGFLFSICITSVNAWIDWSAGPTFRYSDFGGYTYDSWHEIWIDKGSTPNTAMGYTEVKTSNLSNAPAGYMGTSAYLYNSAGTLIANTGWKYNSSSANMLYSLTQSTTTKGTYYSHGYTQAYNGNGYHTYRANRSPNMSN